MILDDLLFRLAFSFQSLWSKLFWWKVSAVQLVGYSCGIVQRAEVVGPFWSMAAGRRHSSSCGGLLLDAASPFVCEAWEEIDSVTCGACSVQWFLESCTYCVCPLPLRATGTVSPGSHRCWIYCPCLYWLSSFSPAGIAPAPAWFQEGFVCQMCLCSLDSWLCSARRFSGVRSKLFKCDLSICLGHRELSQGSLWPMSDWRLVRFGRWVECPCHFWAEELKKIMW